MEPGQDQDFKKCDICKNTKALQFCVDCSCNYCSSCLEPHGRIPATRNHHLEPIKSKSEETVKVKQPTCKEHSDLINAFCKSCKVYICSRCIIMTHQNHVIDHVSEHCDAKKRECEQNLKEKLMLLEKVSLNYKRSADTKLEIEFQASKIKTDIKRRGEDVKNDVDSVASKLIKTVDEELQRHQNRADIVMTEIESIKTTLKVEIEALKKQLNDLKFGNIPEMPSNKINDIYIDTTFSEKLNISFYFDADEKMTLAQKAFGNTERVPKIQQIKMDAIKGKIACFALDQGDIIFCYFSLYGLEINRQSGQYPIKISHNFSDLTEVDFVVIEKLFYIATNNNNIYNVFKSHMEFPAFDMIKIHHRPVSQEGRLVRLSKSLNGDILFVLSRKIIHLSTNGEVVRALDLSFDIFDALELDKKRYVVSRLTEVYTIDCNGNRLLTYSYCVINPPLSFDIRGLAKDNRGNIYVNDYWKNEILVLDHCLNLRSSVAVDKSLVDIIYDETGDKLMALSYGSKNSSGETLDEQTFVMTYEL